MTASTILLNAASGTAGDPLFVENVFSTFLYEGNGSARSITNNIDLSNEGGLTWIKIRDGANSPLGHHLYDTARGATKKLRSDNTDAESTVSTGLTAFNSNGFSLGSDVGVNGSGTGDSYVSWTFRKAPKFFDIQTWSGDNSTNRTISHNINGTVGAIFVKRTNGTDSWYCYHRGIGETKTVFLESSLQAYTRPDWGDTAPTSSAFTVNGITNSNGYDYVAYIFGHNNSDGGYGDGADQDIIKCGSFTHSSSSGNTIDLGFEPQWLLIKSATSTIGWYLWDIMRGWNVNDQSNLQTNSSGAESTGSNTGANWPQMTSTGFKLATNSYMGDNKTYIYIAIRRGPMATPTAASSVFNVVQTTNADPAYVSGFPTDFALWRETGSDVWRAVDRLRGNPYLQTHGTNAENADTDQTWDYMNGHYQYYISSGYYSWMWRRAPGYFDVVAYNGNGSAGNTINHNLGVVPEMMWVKQRPYSSDWRIYHSALGNTKVLVLNTDAASATLTSAWNSTTPSSTVFTLGSSNDVNENNLGHVAYLFATLAGVSKVGSVTHSGTTNVDCGFSSGAKFVLLKRTDSTGGWYVWDSTRGIISGNDPYLLLNDNAGHVTNTDLIDPLSTGFTITDDFTDGTYIFYAIAA